MYQCEKVFVCSNSEFYHVLTALSLAALLLFYTKSSQPRHFKNSINSEKQNRLRTREGEKNNFDVKLDWFTTLSIIFSTLALGVLFRSFRFAASLSSQHNEIEFSAGWKCWEFFCSLPTLSWSNLSYCCDNRQPTHSISFSTFRHLCCLSIYIEYSTFPCHMMCIGRLQYGFQRRRVEGKWVEAKPIVLCLILCICWPHESCGLLEKWGE